MESMKYFRELGLSENILEALKQKGFEKPSPIQEQTIPLLLEGEIDILGQAQTGTGKTAAFGLPIIEKVKEKSKHVQALILTPTRELAVQVSDELNSFTGSKKLNIFPIYGGASITEQLRHLKRNVDIVVGTPGRIMDHLRRGSLKLDNISHFVLDEADEMLNMGFLEEVETIFKETPEDKQTLLFSATMPAKIKSLIKKYLKEHKIISVKKQTLTTNLTDQIYFEINEADRFDALTRIIDVEQDFYGLVFCRTRVNVDQVVTKLIERGYQADGLHGDISQANREKIYRKFKNQNINILVATDVAARGLDIDNLTHVINYSLPQDLEAYVHRIGRTGRAGNEGTAITFVTPSEYRRLSTIQRISGADIRKEKLPNVKELISIKKDRIKNNLKDIIENNSHDKYLDMAKNLINDDNPENILAAFIQLAFEEELNESSYSELRPVNIKVDKKGKTRLFIAYGKKDQMSPLQIIKLIKKNVKIAESKIDDIQIFESFSFVTLPYKEAKDLADIFKQKAKGGKRPLIEEATKSKGKGKGQGRGKGRSQGRNRGQGRGPGRDQGSNQGRGRRR